MALEDAGVEGFEYPGYEKKHSGPIEIGHDVWIGASVVLRGGIRIGTGSVIGANTVVTKDVSPYSVVAGNPGSVVKMRFQENLVERLLNSAWWTYAFSDFTGMRLEAPEVFLDQLDERVAAGALQTFQPDCADLSSVPGFRAE